MIRGYIFSCMFFVDSLMCLADACNVDKINLKLCPVVDVYSQSREDDCTGILVLHPQRRDVKDVLQSKDFETYVYDKPIALLKVQNLDDVEQAEVGSLLGNDWFVEIATNDKPFRAGLMITGSCRVRYVRKLEPKENICLLIGRLSAATNYKFRVGCLNDRIVERGACPGCVWPCNLDISYSNWLSVGSATMDMDDADIQDEVPNISLCSLENNIGDKNYRGVKMFCREGTGKFVDIVLLLENQNDFPIKSAGFDTSYLKATLCDMSGSVVHEETWPKACGRAVVQDLHLPAKGCLAIPLFVDIGIEEYQQLSKIRVEYIGNSWHKEAELLLNAQCQDKKILIKDGGRAGSLSRQSVDVGL